MPRIKFTKHLRSLPPASRSHLVTPPTDEATIYVTHEKREAKTAISTAPVRLYPSQLVQASTPLHRRQRKRKEDSNEANPKAPTTNLAAAVKTTTSASGIGDTETTSNNDKITPRKKPKVSASKRARGGGGSRSPSPSFSRAVPSSSSVSPSASAEARSWARKVLRSASVESTGSSYSPSPSPSRSGVRLGEKSSERRSQGLKVTLTAPTLPSQRRIHKEKDRQKLANNNAGGSLEVKHKAENTRAPPAARRATRGPDVREEEQGETIHVHVPAHVPPQPQSPPSAPTRCDENLLLTGDLHVSETFSSPSACLTLSSALLQPHPNQLHNDIHHDHHQAPTHPCANTSAHLPTSPQRRPRSPAEARERQGQSGAARKEHYVCTTCRTLANSYLHVHRPDLLAQSQRCLGPLCGSCEATALAYHGDHNPRQGLRTSGGGSAGHGRGGAQYGTAGKGRLAGVDPNGDGSRVVYDGCMCSARRRFWLCFDCRVAMLEGVACRREAEVETRRGVVRVWGRMASLGIGRCWCGRELVDAVGEERKMRAWRCAGCEGVVVERVGS